MLCKKMPYHWVKNRWTIDFFIATKKPPHSEEDRWPDKSLRRLRMHYSTDLHRLVPFPILPHEDPSLQLILAVLGLSARHLGSGRPLAARTNL
ncbi:hypothetical protein FRC12_003557, partial [Ceratobasidium sp. 428]